jgi:hypothetical protein
MNAMVAFGSRGSESVSGDVARGNGSSLGSALGFMIFLRDGPHAIRTEPVVDREYGRALAPDL